MQQRAMKIALITINYNQQRLTNELLFSLSKARDNDNLYVIIIDVSDKKPQENIKNVLPHQIIIKAKNGGYSYGVNIGLREAQEKNIKQFCVLNNDTEVSKNFITTLSRGFQKYDAFGGKIYYAPGYEYHQKRYKKQELGKVLWYAGGDIDWDNVYIIHRGVDEVDNGQYDTPEKTEFITGCLFCFNEKILNATGYWNERYFLYYEDADYSMRIKRTGFELWYEPTIELWHKNAQSTQGPGSTTHQKYQRTNRLRFGLAYAPWRTKLHLLKNILWRQ